MIHEKKKILVFIDWFLPGFKAGGPVRSMANMVAHLASEFNFYIVTRNTEYLESVPYPNVVTNQWNDFAPGVKVFYCADNNAQWSTWKQLMLQQTFNAVYVNGIYSWRFSILPVLVAKHCGMSRIIVAPRGMLAASAIGVKGIKKKVFISLSKLISVYKGVQWHVTNAKEGDEVRQLVCGNPVRWVAANLARPASAGFTAIDKQPGVLNLCSFARVSPEKNTLYAIQCLQTVPANVKVVLHLFGQIYNPAYWNECRSAIELLPSNVQVTYHGVVQADEVGERLASYHALWLPSRGENFGHVILESLMAGRPVVISDQTPWLALEKKGIGWDLPLDNMDAFANVFERLALLHQSEYNRLCRQAYDYAQAFVRDEEVLGTYVRMFNEKA